QLELEFGVPQHEPAIDLTRPFHICFKHEVQVIFLGVKNISFHLWIVFADKHTVFGFPPRIGVRNFPALKVAAVEQRSECFRGSSRCRNGRQNLCCPTAKEKGKQDDEMWMKSGSHGLL